jgi:hypothetical protein
MSRHHRWYEEGEEVEDGDDSDNQMEETDSHRDEDASVDEMDYWLQRCSICFDSQLDLCLDYCRDQFCIDCFERLVSMILLFMGFFGLHDLIFSLPIVMLQKSSHRLGA